MREAIIVSGVRTPIARLGGALKDLHPSIYGGLVMKEALDRVQIHGEEVDDVILGNCLAGGGNVARLTALEAGLPMSVAGLTIDRQCGSGINSVALAADTIIAGNGKILIAGGTESMTRTPYLMEPPSKPFDRVPPRLIGKRRLSPEQIGDPPMGITAENLVTQYKISREEQDQFALRSQENMKHAVENGRYEEQIVPVPVKNKKGETVLFEKDEHPRPDTTIDGLGKLRPVFKEGGKVTAGNSSGVNDGASALVMMSDKEAERRGLEPLARVTSWAVAGVDPNIMGIGPVPSTQKLLRKTGLNLDDFDLIEINEAFAAQVLACDRELHFDWEKVNVNGGAIAHGHPIAATGGMLVMKLAYEMKRRNVKRGLVTACIGGGQGIALMLER
ncbi:acetyl-CoA C-acetyltransferase [Scopulibacillus darangshiensis]|uniref:acetyl-CoA C-acetyltransferase n=1 Tax=Scopulibacillus darangshiensis TaxID=442528 RepID=A0A4R2NU52_9BACL|nr:thiolase family protein [Scopulibacillus darangshiensis]TCP25609.1 acetyl-CoA C-acetyltransferase [Scopulibacillus darangshiensis]